MSEVSQMESHTPNSNGFGRRRRRRSHKATAVLGPDRSVTFVQSDLTLAGMIGMLEELLARAKRAKGQSIQLGTFFRILADQNGVDSAD